jgi:hypothetical protein
VVGDDGMRHTLRVQVLCSQPQTACGTRRFARIDDLDRHVGQTASNIRGQPRIDHHQDLVGRGGERAHDPHQNGLTPDRGEHRCPVLGHRRRQWQNRCEFHHGQGIGRLDRKRRR